MSLEFNVPKKHNKSSKKPQQTHTFLAFQSFFNKTLMHKLALLQKIDQKTKVV